MEAIKNWKLKEVKDRIEIVHQDSIKYRDKVLIERGISVNNDLTGLDRKETLIDWNSFNCHYSFYFDNEADEQLISDALCKSAIGKDEHLIMLYGWKEPVVKIPTKLFVSDWEGFIRSALWETFIFSEDFNLIIEVTRDYYMHSNFKIFQKQKGISK